MAEVVAITALALDSKRKGHSRMVRAGTALELEGDVLDSFLRSGAVKRTDEVEETAEGAPSAVEPTERSEVELPVRPSNGATKVEWRSYLEQLKAVTDPEMDEDLEIPADATRDQMIVIGDQRVADWNQE
jgi:hypothetical protein